MMNMILVLVAALAGNIMMNDRQPIEFEMLPRRSLRASPDRCI